MGWEADLTEDIPDLGLPIVDYERGLRNLTHEFLNRLFPSKKRVFKKYDDQRNHWIPRQIVQYGAPGSGKTEFVKYLASKAVEKYGGDQVAAYITRSSLKDLLRIKYPEKHIIILYDDDATLEKLDPDTVRVFTRIRHKCMEDTGFNSGLVITITALHRLHASNPLIRTNINLLVIRSPPAGKYDHDFLGYYIGREGLAYLHEVQEKRLRDESFLGHAVFANPGSGTRGVITNPLAEENYLEEIKHEEEKPVKSAYKVEFEDTGFIKAEDVIFVEEKHDPGFWKHIYQKLPCIERDKKIFIQYLEGEMYKDIGPRFKLTPERIRQIVTKIKQEMLGYAAEHAYKQLHPDYEYHGGNSKLPDFIDHQNKRVISLKCYDDSDIGPGSKWIAKRIGREEYQYAVENNYQLFLRLYELRQLKFFIWRIRIKKANKQDNSLPTPLSSPEAEHVTASAEDEKENKRQSLNLG